MSKVYTIKAGDLLPAIEIYLVDCEGNPIDLTGFPDLRIVVAPCIGGRRIVDMKPVVKDPEIPNKVTYAWAEGETDKPGKYLCEVRLTQADSKEMTLPGAGYGEIVITPRL